MDADEFRRQLNTDITECARSLEVSDATLDCGCNMNGASAFLSQAI